MKNNNLIERYIYDVVERIPANQREEVSLELKAIIEDMVEGKRKQEETIDKSINSVLLELGNPVFLAYKYTNINQSLIGPRWFPLYKDILFKIFRYVIPIILTIAFMSSLYTRETGLIDHILTSMGETISLTAIVFFWFTLFFAFLDRSNRGVKELVGEWSPQQLPEINKSRRISLIDVIGEVIGYLITLGFIIYSLNTTFFNQEAWQPIAVVLAVTTTLQIVHQIFLSYVGKWTIQLFIFHTILNIVWIGCAVIFALLNNSIHPNISQILTANGVSDVTSTIRGLIFIISISIIIVNILEIMNNARKYLSNR